MRFLSAAVIILALSVGCSGTSGTTVKKCTPGDKRNIVCDGGVSGEQTCVSSGTRWSDCVAGVAAQCTPGTSGPCNCSTGQKKGTKFCAPDGTWDSKCWSCDDSAVCPDDGKEYPCTIEATKEEGKHKCVNGTWGECIGAGSSTECVPGNWQECPAGGWQQCDPTGSKYLTCVTTGICTANKVQACKCTAGEEGTQKCNSTRTGFDPCTCGATTCDPNADPLACECSDGRTGTKTCKSDGSGWQACGNCACDSAHPAYCASVPEGCGHCWAGTAPECTSIQKCGSACKGCNAGSTGHCYNNATFYCCGGTLPTYCETSACNGCFPAGVDCATAKGCGQYCYACAAGETNNCGSDQVHYCCTADKTFCDHLGAVGCWYKTDIPTAADCTRLHKCDGTTYRACASGYVANCFENAGFCCPSAVPKYCPNNPSAQQCVAASATCS
jgi:hypothetical protein